MVAPLARRMCALTVAAAASTIVFVGGFGTLWIFWTFASPSPTVPGLFDFISATWGDGVALPLMAGLLAYAIRALPPARGDASFAAVAALLGGGMGVASQALWLAAGKPRPNWTMPRPHRFAVAGWYHAGFVTVVCAGLAALLAVALNRVTLAAHRPRRATAAIAAGLCAGVCFIALLAADSRAQAAPGVGLAGAVIALVGTLLTYAVVIARRR